MKMTNMSYVTVAAISMMIGTTSVLQAGGGIDPAPVAPVEVNSISDILSNGKYSLQIRPRYEFVDEDNIKDKANAFTVRTVLRAKFDALGVDGLGVELEMTDVRNFGFDNYAPESAGYSVVADAEQTRVTQANISYAKDGFVGVVGRKGLNLDNQRFIGTVGWRQMPQTYDLASVAYKGIENLDIMAAYVWQVNRIFDRDLGGLKTPDFDTNTVLLHAAYKVAPELTLTAYDYMFASKFDHIGIRAAGGTTLENGVKLKYMAEYAKQADASLKESSEPFDDAKPEQDADYYRFGLSGSHYGFTAGACYEVLGEAGSGKDSFNTPLATLHAHNGWADMFLATPADGLEDLSIKLGYADKTFGMIFGMYHKFDSDSGSVDYGSEFDVVYTKNVMENVNMMLKGAIYSQGDVETKYVDTTKYWVMFDYKY
ncbi:MAG: alginate export family protein [Sulfurovum sp.]|nr:alginate export family protein [Sulfurovum sp.]